MTKSAALQEEVRHWWESQPMAYDWHATNREAYATGEWFEEIDRRLVSNGTHYFAQADGQKPFSTLVPYNELRDKDVLEIGCGSGAHTRLLAEAGARLTAIDLTSRAVAMTQKRMQLWGVAADVRRMDAELMDFPDRSFDFVWSWGVIHHSSNTAGIISEIARVLRPGGEARVMVYHRRSINVLVCLTLGLLNGRLLSQGVDETLNHYSDGRVAGYYTRAQFKDLFDPDFDSIEIEVFGNKADLLPIPGGKVKTAIVSAIPDSWASTVLSRAGGFLFLSAKRRA